ncbi:MAG: hypothetical protein NTY47_08305, partial [Candidatus Omnitrophica bacterium]|nr:hypothetical protein [Candidatus Omnitrophota bacterium]
TGANRMKTLFMETTKIEPQDTVAQIQRVLGQYGVGAVMTEYDKGEVVALTFKIKMGDHYLPFRLPCRWQAIDSILLSRRKRLRNTGEISKQAKRIAWRQILRWVEAQMALVETDMVKIQEVFMPYIQVNLAGQTLFEKLEPKGFLALEDKR